MKCYQSEKQNKKKKKQQKKTDDINMFHLYAHSFRLILFSINI